MSMFGQRNEGMDTMNQISIFHRCLPLLRSNSQLATKMGEEDHQIAKKAKPRSLHLTFLFALFAGSLLLAPCVIFTFSIPLHRIFSQQDFKTKDPRESDRAIDVVCSAAIANNTFCCDRADYHSDICFMRGDVRMLSSSSSIILHSANPSYAPFLPVEKIRPYTRKWESAIMDNVEELKLGMASNPGSPPCDVRHEVPALFFSAGGYTGNVFHAFSNLLIPLFITSQHLNRRVVLVVLHYREWWYTKYKEILSHLSDYPPIDFSNDTRIHCFPEAIVGTRFHGTLSIAPKRMEDKKTIVDFHRMLDEAYKPTQAEKAEDGVRRKPKLVIVARNGTRVIGNEEEVVKLGRDIGFDVELLRPGNAMSMARIYQSLRNCDAMVGVHGAALTHFLFMRPGSVFIQVVPIGIEELAKLCFGEAAVKMGMQYEEYRVLPRESSLYEKYGESDPIVREPEKVKAKGWEVTKEVYLEGQNVTLDVNRLRERLAGAFQYVVSNREGHLKA